MESSYKHNAKTGEYEIVLRGTREAAIAALRALCDEDVIECDHEITSKEPADDTRWMAPDGVHERSNPDTIRCEICGAFYDPDADDWYD